MTAWPFRFYGRDPGKSFRARQSCYVYTFEVQFAAELSKAQYRRLAIVFETLLGQKAVRTCSIPAFWLWSGRFAVFTVSVERGMTWHRPLPNHAEVSMEIARVLQEAHTASPVVDVVLWYAPEALHPWDQWSLAQQPQPDPGPNWSIVPAFDPPSQFVRPTTMSRPIDPTLPGGAPNMIFEHARIKQRQTRYSHTLTSACAPPLHLTPADPARIPAPPQPTQAQHDALQSPNQNADHPDRIRLDHGRVWALIHGTSTGYTGLAYLDDGGERRDVAFPTGAPATGMYTAVLEGGEQAIHARGHEGKLYAIDFREGTARLVFRCDATVCGLCAIPGGVAVRTEGQLRVLDLQGPFPQVVGRPRVAGNQLGAALGGRVLLVGNATHLSLFGLAGGTLKRMLRFEIGHPLRVRHVTEDGTVILTGPESTPWCLHGVDKVYEAFARPILEARSKKSPPRRRRPSIRLELDPIEAMPEDPLAWPEVTPEEQEQLDVDHAIKAPQGGRLAGMKRSTGQGFSEWLRWTCTDGRIRALALTEANTILTGRAMAMEHVRYGGFVMDPTGSTLLLSIDGRWGEVAPDHGELTLAFWHKDTTTAKRYDPQHWGNTWIPRLVGPNDFIFVHSQGGGWTHRTDGEPWVHLGDASLASCVGCAAFRQGRRRILVLLSHNDQRMVVFAQGPEGFVVLGSFREPITQAHGIEGRLYVHTIDGSCFEVTGIDDVSAHKGALDR